MIENAATYLPPRLFASIAWWVEAIKGDCVRIGGTGRWNKREKRTHRYEIADVRGRLALTVPVSRRSEGTANADMWHTVLSEHGEWWHVHRVTLESAYGRTPYFEHYFPALADFFKVSAIEKFVNLPEYIAATTGVVMKLLGQPSDVVLSADLPVMTEELPEIPQYYQVRYQQLGFIGGLSILDLLFNMGPEALLYLRSLAGLNPDGTPCR
ncbi:MAG: WbqC family protein [Muribaculaceae bacterium]|jgi:WbqC-like protein family.|nr:WbqC family protein [Muribaculaceae bacterium]